jgi:CHAD domain-containing protein
MERLKKLEEELENAAHDPGDHKAIHDVRVAIRRFTQCLRTFAQFFDAGRIKPMRRRLRKLMDRCASARNCDIALEVLDAAGRSSGKIKADLAEQRSSAQKALARRLPSWRKHGKMRHWPAHLHVAKKARGPWNLKQSTAENARRVLPSLAERLFKAGDLAAASGSGYQKLHHFRLKVKQFRYTVELFQSFYDAEMERGDTMLRELQDKLGAISDCGATLEMIQKDRSATSPVRRLLASREAEFRKYWAAQCGPPIRQWWKSTLSQNRS